jgi:hypothetical protein
VLGPATAVLQNPRGSSWQCGENQVAGSSVQQSPATTSVVYGYWFEEATARCWPPSFLDYVGSMKETLVERVRIDSSPA